MRALSFLQPWVYTILELGKDVENRKWRCPDWMIGQPFLMHASAGYDKDGDRWLRDQGYDIPPETEFRAGAPIPFSRSAIVAQATITGCQAFQSGQNLFGESQQWAFGPYVWQLSDVLRFDSGEHGVKGALNFWHVAPHVVQKLHGQKTAPALAKCGGR